MAGDEDGVHPHARRWDVTLHGWVPDYEDPSWVEHCVVTSFMAFRSVLGKACESIRMGDRYFDDRVRKTLERLGCRQSEKGTQDRFQIISRWSWDPTDCGLNIFESGTRIDRRGCGSFP